MPLPSGRVQSFEIGVNSICLSGQWLAGVGVDDFCVVCDTSLPLSDPSRDLILPINVAEGGFTHDVAFSPDVDAIGVVGNGGFVGIGLHVCNFKQLQAYRFSQN